MLRHRLAFNNRTLTENVDYEAIVLELIAVSLYRSYAVVLEKREAVQGCLERHAVSRTLTLDPALTLGCIAADNGRPVRREPRGPLSGCARIDACEAAGRSRASGHRFPILCRYDVYAARRKQRAQAGRVQAEGSFLHCATIQKTSKGAGPRPRRDVQTLDGS